MAATQMLAAIPVLLTLDVPKAVDFYTSRLGFTCRHETPGFAILVRDGVTIHVTKCPDRALIEWSACRVGVTGVDALYQEYAKSGALHRKSTLRDTDYATREFGIVDPDGALITFFEDRSDAA